MRMLAADVGGTFTDLVLIDGETGAVHLGKVPSTPGRADSVLTGIQRIAASAGLTPQDIDIFVHGFTVGTNALLMRSGAKLAMAVTAGFRDVLEIGDQLRPHLYLLSQKKPAPVVPRSRIVEVAERRDAFGQVITALSAAEAERVAEAIAALEPQAVAVCLTFSYLDASHEAQLAASITARLPAVPVYLSSRVNPQIEEYPRANTTAVAAYVGPVIDRYVSTLEQALRAAGVAASLRLMRSDGGVATPASARQNPASMLLSGPAGGVIAGAAMAAELDVAHIVTFDMGGTSADFSIIAAGEPRMVTARRIDGEPLRLPMLDIETISAGGGSIAYVDLGGALRVGPRSAGAEPGPACYGLGGTAATMTDAAVVLGILHPAEFLGGEMPLHADLAHAAIEGAVAQPLGIDVYAAAAGVLRVANAGMGKAVRKLLAERGFDLRDFALLAFGGAGPIYAPYLARELGMAEVLVPTTPGVYAAQGLLMADIRHVAQCSFQCRLNKVDEGHLAARLEILRSDLDAALARDGIVASDRYFRFSADMRCCGQFHELIVALPAPTAPGWWQAAAVTTAFHSVHKRTYGHADLDVAVEIVNLRVEAFGRVTKPTQALHTDNDVSPPRPASRRAVCLDFAIGFQDTPIFRRNELLAGQFLQGPAVITQRDTTTVVLPGQSASVVAGGVVRIRSLL